jgi:hypothetical protein
MDKTIYNIKKQERRQVKMKGKRKITPDEVIFTFEKVLEGWKTIRIYNTIIQANKESNVDKSIIEQVATGNCKIFENELNSERYAYYLELRKKIYDKFV